MDHPLASVCSPNHGQDPLSVWLPGTPSWPAFVPLATSVSVSERSAVTCSAFSWSTVTMSLGLLNIANPRGVSHRGCRGVSSCSSTPYQGVWRPCSQSRILIDLVRARKQVRLEQPVCCFCSVRPRCRRPSEHGLDVVVAESELKSGVVVVSKAMSAHKDVGEHWKVSIHSRRVSMVSSLGLVF